MELDFARTWLPYLYLYGAGGFIFLLGMVIIFRAKSIKLFKTKHKKWFIVLAFGFFWYLAIHGFTSLFAVNSESHHPDFSYTQKTFQPPFEVEFINQSVVDADISVEYAWNFVVDSTFEDSSFKILGAGPHTFLYSPEEHFHSIPKNKEEDLDSSKINFKACLKLTKTNPEKEYDTLYSTKIIALEDSTKITAPEDSTKIITLEVK